MVALDKEMFETLMAVDGFLVPEMDQPLVWTITCSFQPILVDTLGPYMAILPFWLVKSKLLVVKPTVLGSQINFFGGSITLKPLVLARSNYLIT